MKSCYIILLVILCPLCICAIETTPEKEIWPESPQAAKFRHVTMPTPALATGASELSIPLYELDVDGFSIPIRIDYKSNGIRVSEDPFPVGYGWSFLPPLRITRVIQGRPDEKYPFVGNQPISSFSHGIKHRCMNALDNSNRWLDSEYDLFTFHLIDKSFGAILDNGKFQTAGYEEYRIEADSLLNAIKVTDPHGNTYNFATRGECVGHIYTIEWLLSDISLANGKSINFSWVDAYHGNPFQLALQPTIMTYGIDRDKETITQTDWTGMPIRLYGGAKNLERIDFPGGKISLTYSGEPKYREITSLNVIWGNDTVKTVDFFHRGNYNCLLSGVTLSDEDTYSFEYHENALHNPLAQDFWGFWNGKNAGAELAPTMTIKGIGWRNYFCVIGGSDRSPDEQMAQNYLLQKVKYPTGGTLEWEYELHRFKQHRTYGGASGITYSYPEIIDKGGGLRVKKMCLKPSDNGVCQITEYEYGDNGDGLANVIGVPTHETFLSSLNWVHTYIAYENGRPITDIEHDGMVFAAQSSNWLDYQHGATPIWYSEVTERHKEGKIVHKFKNCDENIIFRYGKDDFWKVVPVTINTAFSTGPVEYESIAYEGSAENGYAEVETTYRNYGSRTTDCPIYKSVFIQRKLIQTEIEMTAPDFEEGYWVVFKRIGDGTIDLPFPYSYEDNTVYEAYPYEIRPQREVLLWEQTTEHTPTGDIARKTTYEYVPCTDLISSITTTAGSHTYIKSFDYAKADSGDIQRQMIARNIVGDAVKTTEAFDGCSITETADMDLFGTSIKPRRYVRQRSGSRSWSALEYDYNPNGKLISAKDSADIATSWSWGYNDRYPTSMKVGTGYITEATWKPLVGLSSIKEPNGTTRYYNYDRAGRLAEQGTNGKKERTYEYRINQDGDNYLQTRRWTGLSISASEKTIYDGLGRECASVINGSWGTFTTYDEMGRKSTQWMPSQVSASGSNSFEEFSAMAKSMQSDSHPYDEIIYEPSPRHIIRHLRKAGNAWLQADKKTSIGVYANDAKDYSCPRYILTADGVRLDGIHPSGDLKAVETIDEDGVKITSFFDMRDLEICRKAGNLVTNYIYDGFGQLRYVLPPGLTGTHKESDAPMQKLAFWYYYDGRGNCTLVKTPGVSPNIYKYDAANRLVAESNANLGDKWRLYFYDYAGRQVVCADCTLADESQLEELCRKPVTLNHDVANDTDSAIPGYNFSKTRLNAEWDFRWLKFYDDAAPASSPLFPSGMCPVLDGTEPLDNSKGLLAAMYTGAGIELYFYDDFGREIIRYASGYNTGSRKTEYTYDGQVSARTYTYGDSGLPSMSEDISYSPVGLQNERTYRLVGKEQAKASIHNHYDGLDRIIAKTMNLKFRQRFEYDLHGWPTKRNVEDIRGNTLLSEKLHYNTGSKPCFNGNISAKEWRGGRYDYVYDSNNRLTEANFSGDIPDGYGDEFTARYSYDSRGNITDLFRNGIVAVLPDSSEIYGTLDCAYGNFDGNLLTGIETFSDGSNYEGRQGIGLAKEGFSLRYDDAGNLIYDESRKIKEISYNTDGKPTIVKFSDGPTLSFTYDGLGRLMSSVYQYSSGNVAGFGPGGSKPESICYTIVRQYTGDGHIISRQQMQSGDTAPSVSSPSVTTRFDGGYFDNGGGAHFYITDYQGNITDIADADGKLTQHTDYYPYGEPWRKPAGHTFMFGGKERFLDNGINEYDFHERRLISSYPRLNRPDPHASDYAETSPFVFCGANPVMNIDPTGNDWYRYTEIIYNIETDQFSFDKAIGYTAATSNAAFEEAKASTDFGPDAEYLGKIVTIFDGFYDERLGSDNTLTGHGAKPATVTVYGPGGKDDIGHYIGFTMSSDFEKYGAIDDGMYPVYYDKNSKSGAIKSHYAVNNRGPVNCLGGKNPYPHGYSQYQKDGIFIHRTNSNGTANGMVSIGCLLIDAKQWYQFEKQIGRNNFTLILNRQ